MYTIIMRNFGSLHSYESSTCAVETCSWLRKSYHTDHKDNWKCLGNVGSPHDFLCYSWPCGNRQCQHKVCSSTFGHLGLSSHIGAGHLDLGYCSLRNLNRFINWLEMSNFILDIYSKIYLSKIKRHIITNSVLIKKDLAFYAF